MFMSPFTGGVDSLTIVGPDVAEATFLKNDVGDSRIKGEEPPFSAVTIDGNDGHDISSQQSDVFEIITRIYKR